MEYDKIIAENLNTKLRSEISYLQKTENMSIISDQINCPERLNQLNIVLETLNPVAPQQFINGDLLIERRMDLNTEANKYIYKKQWNKLLLPHKKKKIAEFILDKYSELEYKNDIITKIHLLLSDGKMNSNKTVIYDPNSEKIISIPVLYIDQQKKTFTIK